MRRVLKRTDFAVRKEQGKFSQWCGVPHYTCHSYHGLGWLLWAHKWTESSCQLLFWMLTTEGPVNMMMPYNVHVRGQISCPLIYAIQMISLLLLIRC